MLYAHTSGMAAVQYTSQPPHHVCLLKCFKLPLPFLFLTGPTALMDGMASRASESKVAGGGT